jgi:HSP20 family protein
MSNDKQIQVKGTKRSDPWEVFFTDFPFRHDWQLGTPSDFQPRVDVSETDASIEVHVEVPGVPKENLTLDVSEDNVLTIEGHKEEKKEEKGKTWHRVESSSGSFKRRLQLPKGVDHEAIKAKTSDGVLHISVPKPAAPAKKASKIAIE